MLQLKAQLQSMTDICNERDQLKQKVGQLESSHAQLTAKAQKTSETMFLAELEEQSRRQVEREEENKRLAELKVQSKRLAELEEENKQLTELEEQKKQLGGQSEQLAKLEEQKKQLGGQSEQLAELEEQNKRLAELEEQNRQLSSQAGSRNSELEGQVKTLGVQLEAEQASKKVSYV